MAILGRGYAIQPRFVRSTTATSNIVNTAPNADVQVSGWSTDTGGTTNIYTAIDESPANTTDYIKYTL